MTFSGLLQKDKNKVNYGFEIESLRLLVASIGVIAETFHQQKSNQSEQVAIDDTTNSVFVHRGGDVQYQTGALTSFARGVRR